MYAITTTEAPRAFGASSQGTTSARFVFVSAQLPVDPATGDLAAGGVGAQTSCCIRNIAAVLAELELTLADITKTTVFLTSLADFEEMDEAYAARFPKPNPARTIVGASELPAGAAVQIEAIACR